MEDTNQTLRNIATKLRIHSVNMTTASKSGHPTSCASMAELTSTLFFHPEVGMRYDPAHPRALANDKFILSKGHAAPILYAAWAEAGFVNKDDLLNLRKFTSDLEGHPTPKLEFCDVATGSLGQGLNAACGMAYSMKNFEKRDNRIYVVIGDAEMAEGSNWEAMNFASFYNLDNVVAIVDCNRLGQSDETSLSHHTETYEARYNSFGFYTQVIDGHNVEEIAAALKNASECKGKPSAIIAKTFKGKDFIAGGVEDNVKWHGKALGVNHEATIAHLTSLLSNPDAELTPRAPQF
jgi:transketolase